MLNYHPKKKPTSVDASYGWIGVSVRTTLGSHVEMFATYSRYIKYEYVNKYNANGVVTETGKRNVEQHGINDSKFHLPSFFLKKKRNDAKYVHIAVDFGFFHYEK